jgi:hypothetical protein
MKPLLLYIFLIIITFGLAEDAGNHCSNPFFSKIKRYPRQTDEFNLVANWYNPTKGSPDLLCKNGGGRASLPGYVSSEATAAKGINCAGIITYKKSEQFSGNGKYGFREYISNYINKPLIKGQKYTLYFKFLVTERSNYICHDLGIFFSENLPSKESYVGPLDHINPQIELDINIQEKGLWHEVQVSFIANGKERFMTIGNFKRDKDSKVTAGRILNDHIYSRYCYLMLDKFKLYIEYPPLMIKKLPKANMITFNFNDSISYAKDSLEYIFNYAKLQIMIDSNIQINVQAYSDEIGSKEDNIKICNARALYIYTFLLERGIPKKNLNRMLYPQYGKGRKARSVKIITRLIRDDIALNTQQNL